MFAKGRAQPTFTTTTTSLDREPADWHNFEPYFNKKPEIIYVPVPSPAAPPPAGDGYMFLPPKRGGSPLGRGREGGPGVGGAITITSSYQKTTGHDEQ